MTTNTSRQRGHRRHGGLRTSGLPLLRVSMLSLVSTLPLVGCGKDAKPVAAPVARALDETDAAADGAAPAVVVADLERGLRFGAWDSVAASARDLLASPDAALLGEDDLWRAQRARLIALAWLGKAEAFDQEWELAAAEREPDRLAALAGQILATMLEERPEEDVARLALRARGAANVESYLAGAMQPREALGDADAWRRTREEAVRRSKLPYGHPEGFPRAWLAPDERPEER